MYFLKKRPSGTAEETILYVDRDVCPHYFNSMAGYARRLNLDCLKVREQAKYGAILMAGYYARAIDKFIRLR
ncbi:hypothetical protein [Thermomonospora curvata]|uniref:Uncharacterized protein n=1 Tax=Thermomonospora curvata (strain ATCC 19995 / DSM 43183 / JCM 3096 / KCTC 9072 / NBRC 15933 / NCIMB 10081 / Henssen B9) TaxID=471852 RepID=D1A781_THECD|nr:hypothetical protein [Thermomonospora curvata]ACZ00287.1 hypothetical protein Tcur_4767 [Thermomonospora curvata DSM 43183]